MSVRPLPKSQEAERFRRSPDKVMRLSRLGTSHPTRLSFLRILLRRVEREGWSHDRRLFNFDARGVGRAVYSLSGAERTYSLVVFGHDLSADMRTDRVIATAWDATFCLFDGVPGDDDVERLAANVPHQEAGRISSSELVLSRANRSVRLFEHVVDALSNGEQPDDDQLAETGYLMRTTAVYGSGKFGAASHESLSDRLEMAAPFQAEMLTVWLIRAFTIDLVEHMAEKRAEENGLDRAAKLSPEIKRRLGVGNSTGLGMAPFLVRHPMLLNNWIEAREEALARVRGQTVVSEAHLQTFRQAIEGAKHNANQWRSEHPLQVERLSDLKESLTKISDLVQTEWPKATDHPWDDLWLWGEAHLPLEGQEALLALMLEPHGDLIDDFGNKLGANEHDALAIDGRMSVGELKEHLRARYDWAFEKDYAKEANCARFWYVSEDKLEPRLGERFEEPGGDLELPLDIGRQALTLWHELEGREENEPVARFLLEHSVHRAMVRRVQQLQDHPFAEIKDNLIASDLLPIDMLRCKLAFFGASRFDPRSDRWVRISLFQDCPYPEDLSGKAAIQ